MCLSSRLRATLIAIAVFVALGATDAVADGAGRLEAQAAQLKVDLDRANAEIATLKRSERGVGTAYRLRSQMADAEALARKLTDVEAELRRVRGPAQGSRKIQVGPRAEILEPAPAAEPADGPIQLEAKADLLVDQARQLSSEAESLLRAAGQIRTRQILRRRAGQMERDPFAGLDASKRSMVFAVPGKAKTSLDDSASKGTGGAALPGEAARDTVAPSSPTTAAGAGAAPPAPQPAGQATASPPQAAGPSANTPAPATPMPAAPTLVSAPTASGNGSAAAAGVSLQFRTLLDQETLAEIRRLEGTGKSLSSAEALEKTAAALGQRAQALAAQAQRLRDQAKH